MNFTPIEFPHAEILPVLPTESHKTMKALYPDKATEMEKNIKLLISGELELQNLIIAVQIGEVLRMNANENGYRWH